MIGLKYVQRAAALFALMGGLISTNCMAQPPGPPPPPPPGGPPPPAPAMSGGSRTTIAGVVRNFSYGPGGVDGLILDRGMVIRFPIEYSSRVTAVAPIGSVVSASGWPHMGPAGDTVFDATSIVNQRSQASLTIANGAPPPPPPGRGANAAPPPSPPDSEAFVTPPVPPPGRGANAAPPPPGRLAPATSVQSTVVTGTVRSFNYGIDGMVNGLILSNGAAVYFPPELGTQVAGTVAIGDRVRVTGWPRTGPTGNRLMDGQSITNRRTGASVTVARIPLPPGP
jgi:hypothetical protein